MCPCSCSAHPSSISLVLCRRYRTGDDVLRDAPVGEAREVLDGLVPGALARLLAGAGVVRCSEHVRHVAQRGVPPAARLGDEGVERRSAQLVGSERRDERGLVGDGSRARRSPAAPSASSAPIRRRRSMPQSARRQRRCLYEDVTFVSTASLRSRNSTLGHSALRDGAGRHHQHLRAPNATARLAISLPMAPKPTMPTVALAISRPCQTSVPDHLPGADGVDLGREVAQRRQHQEEGMLDHGIARRAGRVGGGDAARARWPRSRCGRCRCRPAAPA